MELEKLDKVFRVGYFLNESSLFYPSVSYTEENLSAIGTAKLAKRYGADEATVYACLLKNVLHDNLDEIEELFGSKVAYLTRGLLRERTHKETKRKVRDYARGDKRVLFIRLIDRIKNLEDISHLKHKRRAKKYLRETRFYINLGNQYGFNELTERIKELYNLIMKTNSANNSSKVSDGR